jgi:predicted ester cyclase
MPSWPRQGRSGRLIDLHPQGRDRCRRAEIGWSCRSQDRRHASAILSRVSCGTPANAAVTCGTISPVTRHRLSEGRVARGRIRPEVLSLRRLVIGEAARFPELARKYHEGVPERMYVALAGLLKELKARARRIPEELLTQGDLTVADEVIAPDCVHHAPVPVAPGAAGLIEWVTALRRALPDLCALVEDEVAEGDRVAQRLTVSGTQVGPCNGFGATGGHVSWRVLVMVRAGPDGRLTEHWSCWDRIG